MPGIHLLGRVCRVEFSKQPVIYYLTIISIYILIPALMNSSSLGSVSESDNFKEFIFGLLYAIGIGYLAAIAIHLWRMAKGRLFLAARLLCLGMIAMSFGCAIYAGLFPRTPAAEIPSSPVHIIIALGYVVCALGIRRTEQTINSIFNLKASKLPPWFTLVELFGKSEGLDVYKRLEESIKATLNELSKAKLETQAKLVAIGELEQEIKLRKKTERDLIFAKEKAEEANRAKSQFLAMMSHELKTPLTAIKGYGELLRGPGAQTLVENEKLGEVAQQIVINANNLQGMIEGVLQFSQLESGQFTYRKEKFRIADILTYLRSIINEQIDSDAVEYIEKIPDPELAVMTDKHSLQHIIVNLLVNAFKFCKKGHICLEIRKSGDKDLYVAVEDTGIGISNEYREKIFQAFYQISHGTRRKYEELNCQIELDSCVGKGTKFEIFLPDIIFKEPEDEHEST
jgi:signal transduction histidine kinase